MIWWFTIYMSKFNNSIKCFPIKFENVPLGLNTWEQVSTSFCHVHYCWHMTHLFHGYRRSLLECFCLYSIVIYLLITKTVFRITVKCEAFLQIYVVCMSSGDLLTFYWLQIKMDYREFLPYANFITASFITAVFQNYYILKFC